MFAHDALYERASGARATERQAPCAATRKPSAAPEAAVFRAAVAPAGAVVAAGEAAGEAAAEAARETHAAAAVADTERD